MEKCNLLIKHYGFAYWLIFTSSTCLKVQTHFWFCFWNQSKSNFVNFFGKTSDVLIGGGSGLELIISNVPRQFFELECRVCTVSTDSQMSRDLAAFYALFNPFCQSLDLW